MDNSTNPNFIKKIFESNKTRFKNTGVGGIQISDGEKTYAPIKQDSEQEFEQKKRGMSYKNGVVTFTPSVKNIPNARPRQTTKVESGIKIFAISDNPEESKEKKNE